MGLSGFPGDDLQGGLVMCRSVKLVRWALEFLQRGGVGAVRYSDVPGGGPGGDGLCGAVEAGRLLEAVMCLPVERHLALMAQVHADDVRQGPAVWRDLASFVWHVPVAEAKRCGVRVADIQAYGREASDWMVRKWMRPGDGSWREFGRLFDCDHKTAEAYFSRVFDPLLGSWLASACAEIDAAVDDIFDSLPIAA